MNQFQHYLLDEFVDDYREGRMSRRDFVRKSIGVAGGLAAAMALFSSVGLSEAEVAEAQVAPFEWDWSLYALSAWAMNLGKPLAVGLVALAVTLAIVGYFATELAWRAYIVTAWRRRAARRRSTDWRSR